MHIGIDRHRSRSSSADVRSARSPYKSRHHRTQYTRSNRRASSSRSRSRSDDSRSSASSFESEREYGKRNAYDERLKKWEAREKNKAGEFEKERVEETTGKKERTSEAHKLREFLEDYDDERDDAKFYRGAALYQRKKDYEVEKEMDAKDRQKEREEMEKLRQKMADEEREKRRREEVSSQETISDVIRASTSRQMAMMEIVDDGLSDDEQAVEEELNRVGERAEPYLDVENMEADTSRTKSPTARRQLIQSIIHHIPNDKEELFKHDMQWSLLPRSTLDKNVRPWISRRMRDFIGDDEPTFTTFICDKLAAGTNVHDMLKDLVKVLDDDAESFCVKLWRRLIYECEKSKHGLDIKLVVI